MAITTTSSFTTELENMLLAFVTPKPDDQLSIFTSGLVTPVAAPGSVKGSTVLHVNQFGWTGSGGTFTEAARRLTDGTDVSGTPVGMSATQYTLNVREYGGPHDATNVAPLGITELMLDVGTHELAAKIGPHLLRDYLYWRDLVALNLALTTTSYWTAGTTPSNSDQATVAAAEKASYSWLTEIRANLAANKVPAFGNGRYRGFIQPRQTKELLQDSDVKQAMATRPDGAPITGYIGTLAGIDLYEATNLGTTGIGAGSAVTGYNSVFFGAVAPIGMYQHMPMTPRLNKNDDYGRKYLTIWKEHAAYGALDVNTYAIKGFST